MNVEKSILNLIFNTLILEPFCAVFVIFNKKYAHITAKKKYINRPNRSLGCTAVAMTLRPSKVTSINQNVRLSLTSLNENAT